MPDLGEILECNNCGTAAPWSVIATNRAHSMLRKALPPHWVELDNTTAGKVYFCTKACREVWTSTREWAMPAPAAVRVARASGFVPPSVAKAPRRRYAARLKRKAKKARKQKALAQKVAKDDGAEASAQRTS